MSFSNKVQILVMVVLPFPTVIYGNCWVEAGQKYNVDPWLLFSIAEQESNFDPTVVNLNNNSKDVGLMQINSFWFSKLDKFGITEADLLDPCVNIHVGAWVLAQTIQIYGNNWRAIGAYNAGTKDTEAREKMRTAYAASVHRRYVKYRRLRDRASE